MGTETIQVSGVILASPERIYQAWLDSEEHTKFTGGKASVESGIGGRFTAWDGYIEGTTIELEPGRRIVQSWRTTEFPSESPDSRVEIHLEPVDEGTRILLLHSEIPPGQGSQYEQGWKEHYLEPLARYFANQFGSLTEVPRVTEDTVPPPVEPPLAASPRKTKAKPKAAARRAPAKRAKPKRAAKKRVVAKPKKARGRKVAPKKKSARKSASKSKRKRGRR
jgi:uncharacterized protein YndB with AHSA1/START domain